MRSFAAPLAIAACLSVRAAEKPFPDVPGVVIAHSPAASGIFIGSPSLAVLPNGDYAASHDEFGPESSEHTAAVSHVFRSQDRGASWRRIATVRGQFWSTLFVQRGDLYLCLLYTSPSPRDS